ncbi:TPA: PIN domain-containing protein [Escherichia coli]|uniref:PIN domain-containing protein n=1 Tax=Escherichia coli TaxID=562 RepID=UPI001FF22519|nr:PIN domain-containing protein [Escherichia coli]
MKSTFLGFYSTPTESAENIWLDDSTLFVFDTNCLLNLYRCEDHTREDILKVMDVIASRTWIPFQVGFEYQRNRRSVIEDSIKSLNNIKNELESIYTKEILSSGGVKKHLYNSLNKELSNLQEQIKKPIDKYINEKITPRIESKKTISDHDIIRDRIDIITFNKVGKIPTQEQINKVNELGEKRYDNKIPPGFKDASKKSKSFFSGVEFQDKFGDLYLWREIVEKSKSDKIKNVIFICDDNKEDWWFSHSGKTHGALESLKTEICNEANLKNFKLINQLTFLHEAKKYLKDIEISESSLKEVEELSNTGTTVTNETYSQYKLDEILKRHIETVKANHDESLSWEDFVYGKTKENKKTRKFFIPHDTRKYNLARSKNCLNDAMDIQQKLVDFGDALTPIIGVDIYVKFLDEFNENISKLTDFILNTEFDLQKEHPDSTKVIDSFSDEKASSLIYNLTKCIDLGRYYLSLLL